jgi:uncharacterized membrane protein YfcA
MPDPASVISFVLVLAIVATGSAIQVSIGMGLNLFAVPLLMLIDPSYGPAPILVASLLLSILALWRIPAELVWRELGFSVAGLAVGSLVAALFLAAIDTRDFVRVLGAMIVAAVGLILSGITIAIRPASLVGAGTVAGVMGTIAGIHAPPIALLYSREPVMRLRGALLAFIIAGNLLSIVALWTVGRFGLPEIAVAGVLSPGVILGVLAAPLLARRLDAARTRAAVLAISAISGLALVLR